jgi:hypothetical protein
MRRVLGLAGAAAALMLGVAQANAQQDDSIAINKFASFEMTWRERNASEIASKVRAASESIVGRDLRAAPVVARIKSATAQRSLVTVADAPELVVEYLSEYDELRISDQELAASLSPEREISQDEALKIAKNAFDDLARRKLVDPRHYAWDNADVGSTWVGVGPRKGETSKKQRVEYRITLRRMINGIELANAGLRIAVHSSGRVSGLRLGGVSVASKTAGDTEEPVGRGRWLKGKVPIRDLKARFERELAVPEKGKAVVAWSRVMYVMPEGRRRAVVEPLYVVSYSLAVQSDDGEAAISRRKTVGFSLVDPAARPIDLTPPVRKPQIEKTRKPEVETP